jgi:alkylation response protein AidB-like acyl-CoA dehydrogenase
VAAEGRFAALVVVTGNCLQAGPGQLSDQNPSLLCVPIARRAVEGFVKERSDHPGFPRSKGGPEVENSPYFLDSAIATIWPKTEKHLADDVLSGIADEAPLADRQGILSTSTIDRLRTAGFFGLPVPTDLQGGGANLLECAAVQRRLGAADPGLAIAVNMHLFSLGMAVEHWQRRHDSCGLLLEMIASQRRIVASAFAEPELGGTLLRSTATARRSEGGYIVSGVKTPCSLAAHCDLVCFQMQADEPNGLMMALMPSNAPGIRVERTWDGLGMRASGSDTLVLDACFVPDQLIYHRAQPGSGDDEVFAAGLVWFCTTTTATYLGVAAAAVAEACAALKRSVIFHLGSTRSQLPSVQAQLGDLVSATLPIEAACAAIADRLGSRRHDPRSLVPMAVAIKHAAVTGCIRAVEDAAELVGGKAYARGSSLARLWRDVQAARFHPPTRLTSRQLLGKWALGIPFSFELDEAPSGCAENVAPMRAEGNDTH